MRETHELLANIDAALMNAPDWSGPSAYEAVMTMIKNYGNLRYQEGIQDSCDAGFNAYGEEEDYY